MSPRGDVRPGWRIVLDAFIAAPNHELTNHQLGDIRGVQAFRSRISDLRNMGCDITQGEYVRAGCYRYRLRSWPSPLTSDENRTAMAAADAEAARLAAEQDLAAEAPQLFEPERPAPAGAYNGDF